MDSRDPPGDQGAGRPSFPSTPSGHGPQQNSALEHEKEHRQPLSPSPARQRANHAKRLPQERTSDPTQSQSQYYRANAPPRSLKRKARDEKKLVHEDHKHYHYFIFPSGSWRALPATLAGRYRDQIEIFISKLDGLSEEDMLTQIRHFTATLRNEHPLDVQRAWESQEQEKEQAKKEREQARKGKEQAREKKKQGKR